MEAFLAASGLGDGVAVPAQEHPERCPDAGIVVDQQDVGHARVVSWVALTCHDGQLTTDAPELSPIAARGRSLFWRESSHLAAVVAGSY
jgi:hypothetical protein